MEKNEAVQDAILRETTHRLRGLLGAEMEEITVERVVLGLFFSGVKLSNGHGGICFTPIKSIPEAVCCPSSARAMPDSGRMKGENVTSFLDNMLAGNPLRKTIGIAALNALSSAYWAGKPEVGYRIRTDVDVLDNIDLPDDAYVAVVGALIPFVKVLKKRGRPFSILELDPRTLKEDEMPFFVPPEKAAEKIPQADLLVITGTTLINDTLAGILQLKKPGARVIVVGPTASMLPDAFFERGVTVLGGIMVTDPDRVLDLIAEGGSGYHFFGKGAERTAIEAVPATCCGGVK
jgi:uncharacterized protein (DUF4213/DUF364 family)